MISFFQPKQYLIDLLGGFVDIHNHILPGIDDGAQNIDDSIALIKSFSQFGITNFIATPHIMNDYYGNDRNTIQTSYEHLQSELKKNDLEKTSLRFAAEYMIDANFEKLIKNKELLTLKKNYILFEMSYYQAPLNLDEVVFNTFSNGYIPILAHPERYSFYHLKLSKFQHLKKQGMPFQLNALSLSNHYGTSTQKIAYQLLESNMYDYLATDTHNLQHVEKLREIRIPKKKAYMIQALIENTKEQFR